MKKFYFLTLALILGAMTMSAQDVYLRGGHNSWGTGDQWKFTKNGTTWTLEVPAADMVGQEFKIADADWGTYNLGTGNKNMQLGEHTLYNNGGNMKLANVGSNNMLRFTVTYNANGNSKLKIESFSGSVTYPETLYVIGNLKVSSGAWDPSKVKELEKKAEGVFEGTFTILNSGDGNGYFGFIVNKGATSSDWSVNSNRFGASAGDNTEVKKGDESTLAKGENSWKIKVTDQDGMDVSVIVDLKSSKLTIIDSVATAIEEVGVDAGEAVYYNLQGVKVANPENGIFIKKQGNKTIKVVL